MVLLDEVKLADDDRLICCYYLVDPTRPESLDSLTDHQNEQS